MYVCMQIDTISGKFKPVGIFTEKKFGEDILKDLSKELKEIDRDLRFVYYLSEEISIIQ